MGYAVYRDLNGYPRWAGYGVPAECDMPECEEHIDRGFGYRCEEHSAEALVDPEAPRVDGCGLYFCELHLYELDQHAGVEPKPDSREWILHQLIDPSWAQWRNEEPVDVRRQQALLA